MQKVIRALARAFEPREGKASGPRITMHRLRFLARNTETGPLHVTSYTVFVKGHSKGPLGVENDIAEILRKQKEVPNILDPVNVERSDVEPEAPRLPALGFFIQRVHVDPFLPPYFRILHCTENEDDLALVLTAFEDVAPRVNPKQAAGDVQNARDAFKRYFKRYFSNFAKLVSSSKSEPKK